MKLVFKTNGEGRNFESILATNSAECFMIDYNIAYEDYGDHFRVELEGVYDIPELNTIQDINHFCVFYGAEITFFGNEILAEVSFRHLADDEKPRYSVWANRNKTPEQLGLLLQAVLNDADGLPTEDQKLKIDVLERSILWVESKH